MAAGAWQVFGAAIEAIAENALVLDDTGTPRKRMILVAAAYTPAINTHATVADLGANEVTGAGYTAGGNLLACTVARPGGSGTVTFDCNDTSWANSTITAKYAVIVQDANADGTLAAGDLLVCYSDLDDGTANSVSTTDGTFAVNINASGVFTLAQAP